MADAASDASKLKIFSTKVTPFESQFIDNYMAQLAKAMGGSPQLGLPDPNANQATPSTSNYKSPDFSEFFKNHARKSVDVDPSVYQDYINSPEGQKLINEGGVVNAVGGGSIGVAPIPQDQQERVNSQKLALVGEYNTQADAMRSKTGQKLTQSVKDFNDLKKWAYGFRNGQVPTTGSGLKNAELAHQVLALDPTPPKY